jgi:N-hydroxyarylamine O-acetyltransferase
VPLDPDLRAAYLRRLGLEAEPPSIAALQRLHRAQVERVPYETMWIHAGEAWDIDVVHSVERIARGSRGGYCFHLNGAFSELLSSLGYAVTRHVGGVHGPGGPDPEMLTNHLVLSVSGLPSDACPDGTWYVDAGLGDALHEALPLIAGAYTGGPFTVGLEETPGGVGDWHLTHDPAGDFVGMAWRAAPATMADFASRHEWLSTSPDSGFVRISTAERRDATGVDVLRGLVLTRVGEGSAPTHPLTDRSDWFAALADVFGLTFEEPLAGRLWTRCRATHEAWEAAGRP